MAATPMRPGLVPLLVLLGCLLGCRGAGEQGIPTTLLVASDLENAPFAFVDEEGEPAGRDVRMMQVIAEHLGCELEWARIPFARLIDEVEGGRVHVVCATLGVTPERAKRVAFSRPYYSTVLAVVVRNAPGEPRSLADLSGKRVQASSGTTSERAVRKLLPAAVGVFEAEGDLDTVELLRQKKVDAAVMDGPVAADLIAGSWGTLRILEESLGDERYALALARAQENLRDRIDAILLELETAGQLAEWNREFGLETR